MIVKSKNVARFLFYTLAFLFVAHLASIFVEVKYGTESYIYSMFSKWDFGTEKNFPTFFSSINLLASAVLLTVIAYLHREKKEAYHSWAGLALIFYFLCADEFICIHEHFSKPTRDYLGTGGLLYFAWIIPYAVLVLTVGLVYLRFVLNLPPKTRNRFFLCAGLFLFGAMGLEMIQGNEAFIHGNANKETFLFYLTYTIEELLEMSSIIIFISTLLDYIALKFESFNISMAKLEYQQ